jgi:hypothetical protein
VVPVRELPYWPAAMALLIEAGQMTASDYVLIYPNLPLASAGAFSNRASLVNFFFVAFRVMVLFAVGISRRSIWSGRKSAGAARSTTG